MRSLFAGVGTGLGVILLIGATVGHSADAPKPPALDQYGGIKDVKVGEASGAFTRTKIGDRWVLVTPEGHPFWMIGVYNVAVSGSRDDLGGTYKDRVTAKYGDSSVRWGPQQVRRLRSWGFNTIAEYANKWVLPWSTYGGHSSPWSRGGGQKGPWPNPERMPAVAFLWPSQYALRNQNQRAPGPAKEILRATDAHYRGYRGRFPDVFDPNFAIWIEGELRSYGANPWIIGISVDDSDTLFGFGAGPDFDSLPAGKTNPHLGFITLLTPPTQAENKELRITYTDTKVYTKYALRDFLQSRYKTIEALNAAWGSTYTSWDSDGGWPDGRGFLDENGKGAWIGQDATKLSGARPALRTDLDDFLYELADKYFSTVRAAVKRRMPNTLYLGPTSVGSWSTPSRPQVLKAAGRSVDVLRVSWAGQKDRLDYIVQYAGDVPLAVWLGAYANRDSAMFRYQPGMPSQASRGQFYEKSVSDLVEATGSSTGAYPFVGFQWWEFADNWREKANWGLVTLSDNAYDGQEARVATGKDPWGFAVGGEERDYGDFISSVKKANFGVLDRLREVLGQRR
jgi:hypothetical protein